MHTSILSAPAAAYLLFLVAGCGQSDAGSPATSANAVLPAAALRPLGPGDIRITTTDGHAQLTLVGDTIWMGLADSIVRRARLDVDTGTAADIKAGGLGGSIAHMVKGVVGDALGRQLEVPLSDVENIRYEDGAIKFRFRAGTGPTVLLFGKRRSVPFDSPKIKRDKSVTRPVLQSFSEADARRFVAAVQAAGKRS